MQSNSKITKRMLSILLMIVMLFSLVTSAFAGSSSSAQKGGGAYGSKPIAGSQWNKRSQFLRISLYWAPKAPAGTAGVQEDGADWSGDGVIQIGKSFDWALNDGNNPLSDVVQHSNFTSARDYFKNGNSSEEMGRSQSYYASNQVFQIGNGTLKDNNGAPLTFPRPVNDANSVDVKYFFNQDEVINEVAWLCKVSGGATSGETGLGALSKDLIKQGIYINKEGVAQQGAYLLTVESGVYSPLKDVFSAYTMRDAINWGSGAGKTLSESPATAAWAAQAIVLEENMNYPSLNLVYKPPYTGEMSGSWVKNGTNQNTARSSYGIGAFMFWSDAQQLPAISYYYDLTEDEIERKTNDDGSKTVVIKSEAIQRKANTATNTPVVGTAYKANPVSSPNASQKQYRLIKGYVTNRDVLDGNLDIKQGSLQFFNALGQPVITPKLAKHVGESIEQQDVKTWDTSQKFVTTVGENQQASGLSGQHIVTTNDNGLQVNYGNGVGKLQAVFLYVAIPNEPPDCPNCPPPLTQIPPDDPSKDEKTIQPPTNVTIMYFDKKEDDIPTNTETSQLSKEATYQVTDKDGYELTEWVIVSDDTKGVPEGHKTWTEVQEHQSTKNGTSTGNLGPSNWSNPDNELFIRYDKDKEEEQPPLETDLRLTEKRISWLKSLEDIGGIPTIVFQWNAITGHESHTCGSEHCSGHSCNERIGRDSFLRFVSSNTTSVKPSIMGNTTNFMPYDINNVHEFNRSNSGGTYDMHPNYGWKAQSL